MALFAGGWCDLRAGRGYPDLTRAVQEPCRGLIFLDRYQHQLPIFQHPDHLDFRRGDGRGQSRARHSRLRENSGADFSTASEEDRRRTCGSWRWTDMAASLVVMAFIVGACFYFRG